MQLFDKASLLKEPNSHPFFRFSLPLLAVHLQAFLPYALATMMSADSGGGSHLDHNTVEKEGEK